MIIKIIKFIVGFFVGGLIAFALTHTFGLTMEALDISLYDSESDQQRNFNIFILFLLIVGVLGGYFATKIGKNNK